MISNNPQRSIDNGYNTAASTTAPPVEAKKSQIYQNLPTTPATAHPLEQNEEKLKQTANKITSATENGNTTPADETKYARTGTVEELEIQDKFQGVGGRDYGGQGIYTLNVVDPNLELQRQSRDELSSSLASKTQKLTELNGQDIDSLIQKKELSIASKESKSAKKTTELATNKIEIELLKEDIENIESGKTLPNPLADESRGTLDESPQQQISSLKENIKQLEDDNRILQDDLNRLKGEIRSLKRDTKELEGLHPPVMEKLKADIARCDKNIANLENQTKKTKWIGSNEFRAGAAELGINQKSDIHTGNLVNARLVKYTPPKNINAVKNPFDGSTVESKDDMKLVRLGAMTDARNGFTNLGELKELSAMSPGDREEFIEKKLTELKSLKSQCKEGSQQMAAVDKGIAEWENFKTEPGAINKAIEERRACLRDQFAVLLKIQIEENGVNPSEAFQLAHVALLNETKEQKLDKTGWVQNEANQLRDMAEIFDEFNGKTIYFGDKFYVDAEGAIHLPRGKNVPENCDSIKLETIFVNIDVRKGKNAKIQKQINLSFEKLQKSIEKIKDPQVRDAKRAQWNKIAIKLNKNESSNEIAEDVVLLLHDLKIPMSLGCMSAKDRTLIVAENALRRHALSVRHNIENLAGKSDSILSKSATKISQWASTRLLKAQVWWANTGSAKVVEQNTGSPVHKIDKWEQIKDAPLEGIIGYAALSAWHKIKGKKMQD